MVDTGFKKYSEGDKKFVDKLLYVSRVSSEAIAFDLYCMSKCVDGLLPVSFILSLPTSHQFALDRLAERFRETLLLDVDDIVIPGDVSHIPNRCFYGLGIKSISIQRGVRTTGEGAFFGCDKLTNLSIPDTITDIGSGAFRGCRGLTELEVSGVPIIRECTFSDCISLKSVKIGSGVEYLYKLAFGRCQNLSTLVLSKGLKLINIQAFNECVSLTRLRLPASVKFIASEAFSFCTRLKVVEVSGDTEIANSAFKGCNPSLRIVKY